MSDASVRRREMVERQIAARGISDPRVLQALATVPREAFLPDELAEFAYEETPLPIAAEQTISQPFIVALMTAALELQPGDRVLEVGTGSGYAAAVLGRVAAEVYTVERHEVLADLARGRLEALGFGNVHVRRGDGSLGWPEHAPALYGRAALTRRFAICEREIVATLVDLLRNRLEYAGRDGERFLDALHNARVVAAAERYYRIMYYGSHESWNLRDQHMFETLQLLLAARGPGSRAVVWEHNSHVGDASATEMAARGEVNVGQLARQVYRDDAFLVGFGTDSGTVAAAHEWDGPMQVMAVRPSHPESYERIFHDTGLPACHLHLRDPERPEIGEELEAPRLERAIGVIYRPQTERQSHYFQAVLPWQFDEYVWFDRTNAVTPLAAPRRGAAGVPETFPFGL